jgi:hypothetical protein
LRDVAMMPAGRLKPILDDDAVIERGANLREKEV